MSVNSRSKIYDVIYVGTPCNLQYLKGMIIIWIYYVFRWVLVKNSNDMILQLMWVVDVFLEKEQKKESPEAMIVYKML